MIKQTVVIGLLLLTGCVGFPLDPVTPRSATSVASVTVEYGGLASEKIAYIEKWEIDKYMRLALEDSFQPGTTEALQVTITDFSVGGFVPIRIHATAQIVGGQGDVLGDAEAHSTSVRGRVELVAQDIVNQLVAGL